MSLFGFDNVYVQFGEHHLKRFRASDLMTGLLVIGLLVSANLGFAQSSAQRDSFKRAWQALARADWKTADRYAQSLQGYILLPYIKGEQMRQRPDRFSNQEIQQYLQTYADWSFATSLKTGWLRWLGKSGQYDVLLQQVDPKVNDGLLSCYVAHANRVVHGNDPTQKLRLIQSFQTLWLAGKSLPKQCDSSFAWLQKNGGITPELAWQRVALAMDSGETGLATYLNRFLSTADQSWLQRWLTMHTRRSTTLRAAQQWPDVERSWQIVAWGLAKQSRVDAKLAWSQWQMLDKRFSWGDELRMPPLQKIGVFYALDLDPAVLKAIDQLSVPHRDQQVLEWRTRVALANGLWSEVLNSVQQMAPESQQDDRWRYWRARALQQLGQSENANSLFDDLSQKASYYGFLSADWLDRGYQICAGPNTVQSGGSVLPTQATLERAIELFAVDQRGHASRTWRQAQVGLTRDQQLQAARLAADAGWAQQSIFTLNDAGHINQYELRFPLAFQKELTQSIQKRNLDAALVHGLIRAESAWHPQAVSGANARGLMQVTPDTARRLAGPHNLNYRGSSSLLEVSTNIEFGTANLVTQLARFNNDPVAVLAAYNAGPHVQERWQRDQPKNPVDIWVETLPYFETRDYIPRVLAFSVIYDWRLSGQALAISGRMPGMEQTIGIKPQSRAVHCAIDQTTISTG